MLDGNTETSSVLILLSFGSFRRRGYAIKENLDKSFGRLRRRGYTLVWRTSTSSVIPKPSLSRFIHKSKLRSRFLSLPKECRFFFLYAVGIDRYNALSIGQECPFFRALMYESTIVIESICGTRSLL